jgi:hypothetical protein
VNLEHQLFEDEVRRIARILWPGAAHGGATIEDGRERDGVFESEEFIHIIEATVSRAKANAEENKEKIEKLIRKYGAKHPTKFIKGLYITKNEPTGDQRDIFKNPPGRIIPMSFDQFRSKLVDGKSYLDARINYPFGSVRDPDSGKDIRNLDYVPLDIVDSSGSLHTINGMSEKLVSGDRFIIMGDYGAGKSSTLREMYIQMSRDYRSEKINKLPLYINLRDHNGQEHPDELFERHARRIGYEKPASLVKAWRAGLTTILLDGFDEVATAGWAGRTVNLRKLRYVAMTIVRKILSETPAGTGIVISGRAHYFDGQGEMQDCLGLDDSYIRLNVEEFTEEQIRQYLSKLGWDRPVPSWLPSRPLLLGYLASKGILEQALELEVGSSPAVGWNALYDRICSREASMCQHTDPETVRNLIGYIAIMARKSADGLGPLSQDDIIRAYEVICGGPPDDSASVLLQRLPGLGGYAAESGSRVFIDKDFADAARGYSLAVYINYPYASKYAPDGWQNSISILSADIAAMRIAPAAHAMGKITAAIELATSKGYSVLNADLAQIIIRVNQNYKESDVFIDEVWIPELVLDENNSDLNSIHYRNCIIGRLSLSPDASYALIPNFVKCHFGFIEGRAKPDDLINAKFDQITYDYFEKAGETTKSILALGLPTGTKVLMTIIKKLFAQSGSARRESAFYRGLDHSERHLVNQSLDLLRKHGFIMRARQGDQPLWLPVRSAEIKRRAISILAAPHSSDDPILGASKQF